MPTVLRPGDAAPDWVLKDQDGRDLRLSSLSGRPIVLTFFGRAGTLPDLLDLRRLRTRHDAIAGQGAVVVVVSLDKMEEQAKLRDAEELPFTLTSDPEGHTVDLYDAWRTMLFGRVPLAVRRCTYLIDAMGIIRNVYRASPFGNARSIIRDLKRLAAQASWGATPAK